MPGAIGNDVDGFLVLDDEAALLEDAVDERRIVQAVHLGKERGEVLEATFEQSSLHGHGEVVLFFRTPKCDVEAALRLQRLANACEGPARLFEELQRLLAEGGVKGAGGERSVLDGGVDVFDRRGAGCCWLAARDGKHAFGSVDGGDAAGAAHGLSRSAGDDAGAGCNVQHVCARGEFCVRH